MKVRRAVKRRAPIAIVVALIATMLIAQPAAAAPVATNFFFQNWAWTDKPVVDQMVSRTWMWGPEANGAAFLEHYDESPGGQRLVQYYDKSRMEITQPDDSDELGVGSLWYVTNGLLATELISGRLQLGDDRFEQRAAAQVNVAGDADDPSGPTYASFAPLLDHHAASQNLVIGRAIQRDGYQDVSAADFAAYGVRDAQYVADTDHFVASVFWDFMNSSGTIYGYSILFGSGDFYQGQLFVDPYYATGFPITDAYWSYVKVGGVDKDVLIQCFQRRCLTYTPSNEAGWRVEAGNIGQHYYRWRYGDDAAWPARAPRLVIADIWPGQATDTTPDNEYITIRNDSGAPLDLAGWTIRDQQNDLVYRFDPRTLDPGHSLKIESCVDANDCLNWWQYQDFAELFDPNGTLAAYAYISGQGGIFIWNDGVT